MSYRSSGRFVSSDISNRRTWYNRQNFRGARSQRGNASAFTSNSAPNHQLPLNRGRRFFRGNARGRGARKAAENSSSAGRNANGDALRPWISAVNDTSAVYETPDCSEKETHCGAALLDETSEVIKACFDTDLRFPRNLKPTETRSLLGNPYRLIDAQTSKLLDEALPILQSLKPSNPWQQEGNNRSECPVPREEGDALHSGHIQAAYQTLPQHETSVQRTAQFEVNRSCITTANSVWDHDTNVDLNRSYFERLKQKEQQKMSFGVSNPPLLQHQGTNCLWDRIQSGAFDTSSQFAKSEGILSFGAVGAQRSPFGKVSVETGSPGTPVNVIRETWRNPQFQTDSGHIWRRHASDGDCTWSPAVGSQSTSWKDEALGTPAGMETRHVQDCVNLQEHSSFSDNPHRGSKNWESDGTSQVDPFGDSFICSTTGTSTSNATNFSHSTPETYRTGQRREDSPVDVHCAKIDDGQSQDADEVHEVDEGKLLPSDVDFDRLKYVLFFDINTKSFFEEVQKPFLPGSLLYLFYQDPAMLLPTKGHPFYKENTHNWIHFYPDCGTEYGFYHLAAPTVISWMDQMVPLRVKFLVHGHQKQLKLDDMHRKVLYYPTSRVIDVTLLNRMLSGDFDAPRPINAGSVTGGEKAMVVQQRALSGDGETTSGSAAYGAIRGRSFPAREVTIDGPRLFTQGQRSAAVHEGPPTRKKICWDR